jgi:hypothetical protein
MRTRHSSSIVLLLLLILTEFGWPDRAGLHEVAAAAAQRSQAEPETSAQVHHSSTSSPSRWPNSMSGSSTNS